MKLSAILFLTLCFSFFTFGQAETKKNMSKEISISTNFASLYRQNGELLGGRFITTNPYVNIEGTLKLNDQFSLRIPIGYGLNDLHGTVVQGGNLPTFWFDAGPDPNSNAPAFWYENGPNLNGRSYTSAMLCGQKCTSPNPYYLRPHYLRYQIGVFPKFTLHDWEKVTFSITAGANIGKIDKYAVSQYSSFSSVKSGDTIKAWSLNDQRIEYESNPYFFIRGEFLVGFDFQISKKISFAIETGYAHRVFGKGKKPDKIYTNLDNAGYELIGTDSRDTELIYYRNLTFFQKFYNQHFINRCSIRYRIR